MLCVFPPFHSASLAERGAPTPQISTQTRGKGKQSEKPCWNTTQHSKTSMVKGFRITETHSRLDTQPEQETNHSSFKLWLVQDTGSIINTATEQLPQVLVNFRSFLIGEG